MTKKIELLESWIAETNKLLAERRKEKKNEENKNTESILAEYWNRINSGKKMFYLDGYNAIIESGFIDADDEKYDENGAYVDYDRMDYWERVYCTECGAEINSFSEDEEEEITIKKWNRRTENDT